MTDENSLSEWLEANECSQQELGRRVGCSGEHIGRIVKDDPRVSQILALKIFDTTGIKVGPLKGMTNPDIAVVRRLNADPAQIAAAQ